MATHRRPENVFVGREQELGRLREAARAAAEGHGRVSLVAGEAGIGKSRLAEELGGFARARGMEALVGHCYEDSGAPPYWPWAEALRPLLHSLKPKELAALLGGAAPRAATALPDIASLLPGLRPHVASPDSPQQARFLLFDALAGFLMQVSQRTALLLVLEDLHWANAETLGLLVHVARQVEGSRLMLLLTYRPEDAGRSSELSKSIGELARLPACDCQTLRALSETEVTRFCERVLPRGTPAGMARAVYERTGGNPLFLQHLASHLLQRGALRAPQAVLEVPEAVRKTIRMRIDRLTPACARVLRTASVLGMEIDLGHLARAVELPTVEVGAAVDEALGARLLEEEAARVGHCRFSHALVRDAVLAGMSRQDRILTHARVATALEACYGADADAHAAELVEHLAQAQSIVGSDALVRYCLSAGQQALTSLAGEKALGYFERGIGALEGHRWDERIAELTLGRALALAALSRSHEAFQSARAAFDMYREHGNPAKALDLFAFFSSSLPESISLYEEALGLTQPGSIERGRILRLLGFALIWNSRSETRSLELLDEALAIARNRADKTLEQRVIQARIHVCWYYLRLDEFRDSSLQMIELAEQLGDARAIVASRVMLSGWCIWEGKFDDAREQFTAMARAAERSGLPYDAHLVRRQEANAAKCAGDWERARELSISIVELGAGGEISPTALLPPLIEIEYFTGRFDAGKAWLERLLQSALTEIGRTVTLERYAAAYAARAAYLSGDTTRLDEARALAHAVLAKGVNPCEDGIAIAGLGMVAIAEGDRESAARWHERLSGPRLAFCEYFFPEVAGAIARCAGRTDEAVRLLDAVRERFRARRPSYAWICYELGEALLQRDEPGDVARARGMWNEALRVARELEMSPLERKVEGLLTTIAANGRVRFPAGLSRREVEVVRLVARGKTNKEIAFDLHISEKTVQSHLASIFAKVGAANRAEAAAFAAKSGLL